MAEILGSASRERRVGPGWQKFLAVPEKRGCGPTNVGSASREWRVGRFRQKMLAVPAVQTLQLTSVSASPASSNPRPTAQRMAFSLSRQKRRDRAETINLTHSKSRYEGYTIPHIKATKRISILINRLLSQCFPSTKAHMNPLFQSHPNPHRHMDFRQTNEHIRQCIQTACHLPYSGTCG